MNIEYEIKDIKNRLAQLEQLALKTDRESHRHTSEIDDTSNKVTQITPYTASKTAYYEESFKTFYEVPQGNVAIYFDNYNGDYTFEREEDRIYVTFKEPLKEQTNITISIQ